jgi:hypothetical protein
MTRFRLGGIFGFAAGFYVGAMAGRQWFDRINKAIGKVVESGAFGTATGKAKAVVDLGVERAKDVVPHRKGNGGPVSSVTAGSLARTPGAPGFDAPTTN